MRESGRNPARIIPAWQDWVDRHASGAPGIPRHRRADLGRPHGERDRRMPAARAAAQHGLRRRPGLVAAMPLRRRGAARGGDRARDASHPSSCRRRQTAAPLPAVGRDSRHGRRTAGGTGRAGVGAHLRPGEPGRAPRPRGAVRRTGGGQAGADNAVLVVSELAANSIKYGGGAGILRLWRDVAALVCEVRDNGVITDPLAGRRRPSVLVGGKAGLWIANQVCDLLQIRSAPGRGSCVRCPSRRRRRDVNRHGLCFGSVQPA